MQKAGATTNEYWAVSSAVLSASPDRAAMLLAMQGQRGTDPKDLRFITATVRVDFDKSARRQVAGGQPQRAEEAADGSGADNEPTPQDRRRGAGDLHALRRSETATAMGTVRSSRRIAGVLIAAAITASTLMLVSHEIRSPDAGA